MSLFFNRVDELSILEEEYSNKSSSLFVIYGRRRVGKTELVLKFIENKPAVYHLSQKFSIEKQAEDFLEKTCPQAGVYVPKINQWDQALKFITENLGARGKPVIVIDEVPYLIEGDGAATSALQSAWDLYLKDSNMMLILLGSSIGMMETEVLGYKSPLYGRRTGQLKLEPLKFRDTSLFFPGKDMDELVKIYGCVGGIPAYLLKFDSDRTFIENVDQRVLKRATFLYDEAIFLLKEELREPTNYELILEAISKGKSKMSLIADETGISVHNIPKYLRVLINLGLIVKEYPVCLKKNKGKRSASVYKVSDNFFSFWYRYVFPARSELETNRKAVIKKIENSYDAYLGHVFEHVCKQFLQDCNLRQALPFSFEKIGRQWGKIDRRPRGENTYEIDLTALNDEMKHILFVECKWQDLKLKDAKNILAQLKEKSGYVQWNNDERIEYFGIMARKINKKETLRSMGFIAFDLDDFN